MNSLRTKALLLLCALFLASCGITPIPPDKLSQARTIGAISLLGDELHIVQIGTTVFNNVDKDEKAGWAMDRFTTQKIKNILAGKSNLKFVDIDYKYSDFEPIYQATTRFPAADYDLKYARDALSKLRQDYGIDLLILVARTRHGIEDGIMYVHGCAIYNRSLLGISVETKAYLAAEIAIVDMADFKILTDALMIDRQDYERRLWKENVKDYSGLELRFLEAFYKGALESRLNSTLAGFGLLPKSTQP